jgi:class 3 adenylate cyclase
MYASFGILDIWATPNSINLVWSIRFGIGCPTLIAVLLLSLSPHYHRILQPAICMSANVAGLSIVAMISCTQNNELGYMYYYIGLILCFMFFYTFMRLRFWYALTSNLIIIAAYEIVAINQQHLLSLQTIPIFFTNNFFLLSASIVGALTCYTLESYSRKDYLQRCIIESEKAKAENLLLNILPEPIANRLKQQNQTIADSFESVSVLYADIANFTPLSNTLTPPELVNLLNNLFTHFDILAEKYGVEKIKTVGDCYMAATGVPLERTDHAFALASMALEMRDYVNALPSINGWKLGVRIGLNSGPVVAGVIGRKKYIYDLWGDTVNIASRMESHGSVGKIQITHAMYELLKDNFVCDAIGQINIKGRGLMEVWYLLGVRENASPNKTIICKASD